MKERGLCFSTALVPAVLDGQKFVTRRLGGLSKYNINPDRWHIEAHPGGGFWATDGDPDEVRGHLRDDCGFKCPQGVPGDRFYMRETWCPEELKNGFDGIRYRADNKFTGIKDSISAAEAWSRVNDGPAGWRSPRFMPKWAARPQRWEIVSIRPERVQDITDADAIAEGVGYGFTMNAGWPDYLHIENGHCTLTQDTARISFATLWDSINAKRGYGFGRNNWVWRIEWNPEPVEA